MKKEINIALFLLVIIIAVLAVPSCKKYEDPPPFFEDNIDTSSAVKRKVLIIGIDGAVGSEYKIIAAPVLEGLKAHSKYSWEAVSDEATSDAASWKTLIAGVSFSRHQIQDSSFIYSQPLGGSQGHEAPAIYPSFFNYILGSSRSDLKTSFITPWKTMLDRLVPEVEDKVLGATDAAVKDSALLRVKKLQSDLIIVNFNSVAIAGKASGFSATAAGYKDAVLKVDGYVGELMTALKARPEYNKAEEWLVIITGTHGGTGNTYGGASEKETNVVSFYYNEKLKQKEFTKIGSFSGVQMKGRDDAAIKGEVLNDGGIYDPATNNQQTIQIKVKGTGVGSYPHFFSKMTKFASTPGWSFFANGSWAVTIIGTTGGESRIQGAAGTIFDNQWHTLTIVFVDSANAAGTRRRYLRRYTDARRIDQTDITDRINITSPSPVTIGWGTDPGFGPVTFFTADAMIFNAALSDAEINSLACLKDITQHSRYDKLIGYWPANDGFGGRFKNKAPVAIGKDFILKGAYQWEGMADAPCTTAAAPSDPALTTLLVKGVDAVANTFYWLKIPAKPTWLLEGSAWLASYESEFIKL